MKLQEEFSLESILTIVTGINCTNDFYEVYELYWFMFENEFINDAGLLALKDKARSHILNIHPELKNVSYSKENDLDTWIFEQKSIFGDTLPISLIGEPIYKFEKQPVLK